MTPAELEAIRARNAARTQGRWAWDESFPKDPRYVGIDDKSLLTVDGAPAPAVDTVYVMGVSTLDVLDHPADSAFIAHASEDIPALLAEVERLRRALMSSRLVPGHTGDLPTCIWQDEECGCWRHKHNAAIDAALRGEA